MNLSTQKGREYSKNMLDAADVSRDRCEEVHSLRSTVHSKQSTVTTMMHQQWTVDRRLWTSSHLF